MTSTSRLIIIVLGAALAMAVAAIVVIAAGDGGNAKPKVLARQPAATAAPANAVAATQTPRGQGQASQTAAAQAQRDQVIAAVRNSDAVYIRAMQTLDRNVLATAYSGTALAEYQSHVDTLASEGEYEDDKVLSFDVTDVRLASAERAIVTTNERWLLERMSSTTGATVLAGEYHYDEYYEVSRQNGIWLVSVNTYKLLP